MHMNLPPTTGGGHVNYSIISEGSWLVREPVEQVVALVAVKRTTQTLSDGLWRDVDLKIDVLGVYVANDLVARRHLNLRQHVRYTGIGYYLAP